MRRSLYVLLFAPGVIAACGWNPKKPFERESPQVREAIKEYDAGQHKLASNMLEEYLSTGACRQGAIGTPPRVKDRPNASYDLGLTFFEVAQALGKRFGEEDDKEDSQLDPNAKSLRSETIECALAIVRAVAGDASQPPELRARARYVEGNLLFLNANYEDAIKAYDQALEIAPGMHQNGPTGSPDSGRPWNPDAVGRDVAWNRSIALRRLEDQKDAGKDSGNDSGNDGGGDGGQDQDPDGGQKDQGDAGQQKPQEPQKQSPNQDERLLDQLENAPTVQQEAAKKAAQRDKRGIPHMVDK